MKRRSEERGAEFATGVGGEGEESVLEVEEGGEVRRGGEARSTKGWGTSRGIGRSEERGVGGGGGRSDAKPGGESGDRDGGTERSRGTNLAALGPHPQRFPRGPDLGPCHPRQGDPLPLSALFVPLLWSGNPGIALLDSFHVSLRHSFEA